MKLLSIYKKLWVLLQKRRKIQLCLTFLLMVAVGISEVLSLGAVIPFLAVLLSTEKIKNFGKTGEILIEISTRNSTSIELILTILFISTILIATSLRLTFLYVSTKLSAAIGADLSCETFKKVLNEPYNWHVATNSSLIISTILSKVNSTAAGLYQILISIYSALIIVGLVVTLVFVNAEVAIASCLCFGVAYLLIGKYSKLLLQKNGRKIADGQIATFKTLQEALGGIRDVILDNTQAMFSEKFRLDDQLLRVANAQNTIISGSPKFIMEFVGMAFIVLIAYTFSSKDGGLHDALPILGGLAVSAQRLLPSIQQCYSAWAQITISYASVTDTIGILEKKELAVGSISKNIQFCKSLEINNISFRYSEDTPWVLRNISLKIPQGARIGFVGETGSGKSTLLDIIMGLLIPTEGSIIVDGTIIKGAATKAWQRSIAHVPQSIFLTDASVAENIAFGLNLTDINMNQVIEAAEKAQIANFIESRKNGYQEIVGERGVRLSGGQRQRIGIARALYKKSQILIFDEATSALDNTTEEALMDTINKLDNSLTILMIAHRISSLKGCDTIVQIKNGKVITIDSYPNFIKRNRLASEV